eukprot:CAMPEP_0117650718 /NCGR_PEP_ID=MMETSP0804-20121206/1690_1 /TAXON_ID=1074897 /ORGANISM="Tetraselmis astigmatica, Strain CCMP880" /LENGTH=121 /DNA_ID=CAMNT_0005456611 /DNA_START=1073 /DNA_END=1439 /DNA_ORIENTATION=+
MSSSRVSMPTKPVLNSTPWLWILRWLHRILEALPRLLDLEDQLYMVTPRQEANELQIRLPWVSLQQAYELFSVKVSLTQQFSPNLLEQIGCQDFAALRDLLVSLAPTEDAAGLVHARHVSV